VVIFALLLLGCDSETGSSYVGTWKQSGEDRFITIQHNAGEYSAILFTADTAHKGYRKPTFPAVFRDGVLTVKINSDDIPVLYHPIKHSLFFNGQDEFLRVQEHEQAHARKAVSAG